MGASGNIRAGKAYVEIMLDHTAFERGLKAAQNRLKKFGSAMTSFGMKMVAVAGTAAFPFAAAVKNFAGFDDQMRMVKAVTGSAADEFAMLTETAERLGRETSFTAKQVAEGMTAMGRMGFKAPDIDAAISSVLNLARATGTELGDAAEIAANNMRVFGIASSEFSGVADILTAAANGSAQTLIDLSESLKMAGPQASAAGDSIRNVAASLGVLANMGIRGSLAGTALRKAYSQFANTKIQKKLGEFGISTVDAEGNLRAIPEIMADIAKAMAEMPTAGKLEFAEEIFDLRGALAGLQLGGNIDQLNEFIDMLGKCGGVAENTAVEMDRGIGGAVRRFLSAVEGVQISVGRLIGETLSPYIDRISVMLNRLAEWASAHRECVMSAVKVVSAVAAVGAALTAAGLAFRLAAFSAGALNVVFGVMKVAVLAPLAAVGMLSGAYHALAVSVAAVKTASVACWAVMTSPAVIMGAVLGSLVVGVSQLTGAWNICREAGRTFGTETAEAVREIGSVMAETWRAVGTALKTGDFAGAARVGFAALKLSWLKGIEPLRRAWLEFRGLLADSWTMTVYGILKIGNNLWYGLLTGMQAAGDAVADAWMGIWNGVLNMFGEVCRRLERQWIRFRGVFDGGGSVDAALKAVDRKYAEARDRRELRLADSVNARAGRRESISEEWTSSGKGLDEAMQREILDNQRKTSAFLEDVRGRISLASSEWKSAVEALRANAAERHEKVENVKEKTRQAAESTRIAAQRAGVGGAIDASVSGSWSLRELQGMLGNDSDERIARASESTVRLQCETNRYLRKMSAQTLSYGG